MYCLSTFCSVCLKKTENYKHFLTVDKENEQFVNKLASCSYDITWVPSHLTLHICYKCFHNLQIAYKFTEMCRTNSATIKQYLKQLTHATAVGNKDEQDLEDTVEYLESEFATEDAWLNEETDGVNNSEISEQNVGSIALFTEEETEDENVDNLYTNIEQNTESIVKKEIDNSSNMDDIFCTSQKQNNETKILNKEIDNNSANKAAVQKDINSQDDRITFNYKSTTRTYAIENVIKKKSNTDKQFACSICDEKFVLRSVFMRHWVTHGVKMLSCALCDKKFSHMEFLNKHILTHSGKQLYMCKICGTRFAAIDLLNQHILEHNGVQIEEAASAPALPFPCTLCDRRFPDQARLEAHMLLHNAPMPNTCPVCNKSFSKRYLKLHMVVHTGEKPYSCYVCGRGFARKPNLDTHLLIHTDEKPFKCDICSKRFIRPWQLDSHLLSHTGVRPHKCAICEKSFKSESYLKKHVFYHTGQKPYKCSLCAKSFKQNDMLKQHLLKHIGEKPYKCSICNKGYSLKDSLRKHLPKHEMIGVKS